jgi:hypothetical protein
MKTKSSRLLFAGALKTFASGVTDAPLRNPRICLIIGVFNLTLLEPEKMTENYHNWGNGEG